MSYQDFFHQVCGFTPYPFQRRFHELKSDLRVLEVPTGLGKTMTVVADWLFDPTTTRLVYCLPGRALTQQVLTVVRKMVAAAGKPVEVLELMGGAEDLEAKLRPDQLAILIGTQDILVSRALNRGYALSPFRWPIFFGLLNNDVTWVFDEVQLLGEVVATGAQLAGLRDKLGAFGKVRTVWMTATFERSWLDTADFHQELAVVKLEAGDIADNPAISKRIHAPKLLQETTACDSPRECAVFVKANHAADGLTLVIANTVTRAQEIWDELRKLAIPATLLHSRFRPSDRKDTVDQVLAKGFKGVIIATQVIEAGVDLDANLMITDAAPWSSLVQRFGRVNRAGDKPSAQIFWVRNPQRNKKVKLDGTQYRPYEAAEVLAAIALLETLQSASPAGLAGKLQAPVPYRYVLRRIDLIDLFDTTPDLAGNQIDVSRFVRSGDETSVFVAWRSWQKEDDPAHHAFAAEELCPVPFFPGRSELKEWLKKNQAWSWNYLKQGRWEKVEADRVFAGMRLLVRSEAGGYDTERGWAPESKTPVTQYQSIPAIPEMSMDSDYGSQRQPQSLADHSDAVVYALLQLLGKLEVGLNGFHPALQRAARLHDWGKAHPVFQQTLQKEHLGAQAPRPLLAKQTRVNSRHRHARIGFRHELASALAALAHGESFLTAYLAASHHGKVRGNIRSLEGEKPERKLQRIARGIQQGDTLFAADLGEGEIMPEIRLDLQPMDLGASKKSRGWADQVMDLLDELGPFRLAYLEMLLRSADEQASGEEVQ